MLCSAARSSLARPSHRSLSTSVPRYLADEASPSATSSDPADPSAPPLSPSAARRARKPKWTRAQLRNRDYVSLGLPPSRPDHEQVAKPLKRKAARALAAKQAEDDELNGRVRRDGTKWLSAQEFEEKLYREDLKARQKAKKLDEMLGTGAIARKRWAWEWFSEGKELKDIGIKMA